MTTLLNQNTTAVSVTNGFRLSVAANASSTAFVEVYEGDQFIEVMTIAASETKHFGGYPVDMVCKVTCLTGSLNYSLLQSTGGIGEYAETVLASGDAVSLVTNTAKTVLSISLTAGDWDVSGVAAHLTAASTSITHLSESISLVDDTMGALGTETSINSTAFVPGANSQIRHSPTVRLSLTATTTVYLVFHSTFTVSTLKGYGVIKARRVN